MTEEERQRLVRKLKDRPAESIEDLKLQLAQAWRERDDWQWAYQLTEGILKADPKWHGVNERFSDQSPIVAAKLAKEAMGKRRYNSKTEPVVVPDYYRDLMEWLKSGTYRVVQRVGSIWRVRDEATGRNVQVSSLDELLKSEAWIKFKKGL